jgi:hypothetical protein
VRPGLGTLGALLLVAAGEAAGQEARLDSLRAAHDEAAVRVAAVAAARQDAGAWADERYRRIAAARAEGDRQLREALRAAQNAADSLDALDARLAEALAAEHEARGAFREALELELERTLRRAEFAPRSEKTALSERARALAFEFAALREPVLLPVAEVPDVAIEPGDGPQEIALKADFLADRAVQLRGAADVVSAEMARVQKRLQLQEEMAHLLAEVRLFDDAGVPPTATDQPDEVFGQDVVREICCDPVSVLAANATGPADAAVAGAGGLNLPMLGEEGGVAPAVQPESFVDQLARLRENLLRRAEVLERRSEEFRSLLQNRP